MSSDATTPSTTTPAVDSAGATASTPPAETAKSTEGTSDLSEAMSSLQVKKDKPSGTGDGAAPAATQEEGLTLRAFVSSKEAGVIIGRGGATIATLRTETGVKAGVSKVVPGVADRILSIGGSVEGVAKAYSLVAQTILENPVPSQSIADIAPPAATSTTVRLLISHLLIGSVIGKGGAKIREIQDVSGARMVASKEMLPQSTERVVEVTGGAEGIRLAVAEIAKCLIEDWDRSQGTVLYHPGSEGGLVGNGYPGGLGVGQGAFGNRRIGSGQGAPGGYVRRVSGEGAYGGGAGGAGGPNSFGSARRVSGGAGGAGGASNPDPAASDSNYREQKISIPSDMVGCIIGRAGTKINEIRRLSGSKISIAKTAHDDTGERMFVISGLPENNEKALYLLYSQLESEKERRVQSVAEEEGASREA